MYEGNTFDARSKHVLIHVQMHYGNVLLDTLSFKHIREADPMLTSFLLCVLLVNSQISYMFTGAYTALILLLLQLNLTVIYTGYSLCYGTILVKMFRVWYIFNNHTLKKKIVSIIIIISS